MREVAIGVVAGLVASFVMSQYDDLVDRTREARLSRLFLEDPEAFEREARLDEAKLATAEKREPAAVKAAEASAGRPLSEGEKDQAAHAETYAAGTAFGALYGMVSSIVPFLPLKLSIPARLGIFAIGHGIGIPGLGASKRPRRPASNPLNAIVSRGVFGASAAAARAALRRILT